MQRDATRADRVYAEEYLGNEHDIKSNIARGRIERQQTAARRPRGSAYQILETLHSAPPASYSKFDTAIRVPSANDTRTGADGGHAKCQ